MILGPNTGAGRGTSTYACRCGVHARGAVAGNNCLERQARAHCGELIGTLLGSVASAGEGAAEPWAGAATSTEV